MLQERHRLMTGCTLCGTALRDFRRGGVQIPITLIVVSLLFFSGVFG